MEILAYNVGPEYQELNPDGTPCAPFGEIPRKAIR
jgi:hypothetical protein